MLSTSKNFTSSTANTDCPTWEWKEQAKVIASAHKRIELDSSKRKGEKFTDRLKKVEEKLNATR